MLSDLREDHEYACTVDNGKSEPPPCWSRQLRTVGTRFMQIGCPAQLTGGWRRQ